MPTLKKYKHGLAVTDQIPARLGFREPDEGEGMCGRLRFARAQILIEAWHRRE
jgi:hypothetical protein